MGERPPVLIGERVLWLGSGSGLPKGGKVKWIGRLPEMGPHWAVGIELDEALPYGGIDGTWGKRKLFKCRHKHGLIVPHSSVIPQPQQPTRRSAHTRIIKEFSEPVEEEPAPNKGGNKVGKLFRALSNDESRNRDPDLELPSTHLRNTNLERQLAILGTLRRSKQTDLGRLEGIKSEACLYSVILEKEENVFRERRRMIHGREFKRSDDTLDRTSSINSSRSVGSKRDRSSGIFSFFRWFKKERNDDSEPESSLPGSPILQRASGSVTGSIDTLFSTATTRSFAYVPPSHYRPYGTANPPEIRICPGPDTNTYKNRIRQRDLLRQSERNISLREKYRLYASETLPRSVDRINEITEVPDQTRYNSESKNSSIRRQKRPAPPPPALKNNSSSERDLTSAREGNFSNDGRQHRRTLSEPSPTRYVKPCHVKGKRKAPQPPSSAQAGPSDRTLSLQRRKRRAPPPPIQRSPSDEINEIFRQAVDEITGSTSSLSHLETASTASTVDISQADVISTDTLRLERGYLRPNREEKQMEVKYTPASPVSPRPWYKRNTASRENSFSRSNDRKKDRDRRRVEDWMIESGIPRRPNHLPENRINLFTKMDKTEEKRRSQISILTNISELDREAAEIVQKNKEKQQALLDNQNNKFYVEANFRAPVNGYFTPEQSDHNVKTNNEVVTLFNSITNVTNVTVNSAYFLQNGDLGRAEPNQRGAGLENRDSVNRTIFDEQEIRITEKPIITELDQEPGPSGVGRIAKVTIEELDDFDKERNSKAQALYEANRLQRHQSPPIPTITEVSESALTTPASTVANTPSDPLLPPIPGPSTVIVQESLAKPGNSQVTLPASALRPVVHVVWNCPRCTLENPRWKITCEACDMWRPVPCEFKEVTPKHPLPLAVLRIIEPKDPPATSAMSASKEEATSSKLPIQNETSQIPVTSSSAASKLDIAFPSQNGTPSNKFHDDKGNSNTKNFNLNITEEKKNITEEKNKKSSQRLTISDLLFNTKGNLTPKENLKCKDILNGFGDSKAPNSQVQGKSHTNDDELGKDSEKLLNTNKQPLLSNETTPSGSGSSISSMSSSNSDKPVANELQRSPKRDVMEPEEIRRARLAFFEKFILPTHKPSSDINSDSERKQQEHTKISHLTGLNPTPNAGTKPKENNLTSTPTANLSPEVVKSQQTDVRLQENEYMPVKENKDTQLIIDNRSTKLAKMTNSAEAIPQAPKNLKLKSEMNVQTECKAKESQTSANFPCKPTVFSNQEEDKKKLREMLIEMKHSLPKRSKKEKDAYKRTESSMSERTVGKPAHINGTSEESPRLGAVRKSIPEKPPQNPATDFKHEPSTQAEAYLVESETIVEEIKMKKPSEKTSSSAQTSAVVRQISPPTKPPIGKEVVVPITVEEYTIKDGVLYTSVSKGAKKIGSGTFQLMRPRDFANVEAIKTRKNDCDTPLYANVETSPCENVKPPEEVTGVNSKEVEKLSIRLTEPQGLAHFRAVLANNDAKNMNTIAVNRLLRRLESAIANGQHELAAALAKELAQLKVNCVVTRQKPEKASSRIIEVDMFVEDKETHRGPFPLRLTPCITVANLKLKVEREYEIPSGVQRWIIGKVLANDDKATLESLGITESGSILYLYLVVPEDPKLPSDQMGFSELEGAVGGDVQYDLNKGAHRADSRLKDDSVVAAAIPCTQKTMETSIQSNACQQKLSEDPLSSEWKCRVCTLVNEAARPKCAACGLVKHDGVHDEPSTRKEIDSEGATAENTDKYEASAVERKQDYQKLVDLEKSDLILSTEVFECPICLAEYQPQEGVVLRECLHVFCRSCLANTVEYSDEAEVKCPFRDENYTCDSSLLEREIKALVTPEAYEQHLAKSIALAETKIGNTFHCKTPDCKGWCIFEDNVNLFRCPVCTHTNCLTCQAIHEGLDCKQFQEQLKKDSEVNVESKRTTEMLQEMVDRGEAMNCPTCQVVLMKKWGCDWLRCSMCKTEICWITRGPRWGPNGKGDTNGGCQCGVNGVKCHPKCTYCH